MGIYNAHQEYKSESTEDAASELCEISLESPSTEIIEEPSQQNSFSHFFRNAFNFFSPRSTEITQQQDLELGSRLEH